MARLLSDEERAILALLDYKVYGRLAVEGVPLQDVISTGKNPLRQGTVIADLDQVCQTGQFTCRLLSGADSLSPDWSGGLQVHGAPAFEEDRSVSFEIQVTRPGIAPAGLGWRNVFQGAIDDVTVNAPAGTVTVNCRDGMSSLLLTEIENISDVDGQPAWGFPVDAGLLQDQAQQILDTAWQYSYGSPFPSAFVILDSPTDSGSAFWQARVNLMQALRDLLVGKNGRDVRGRWDLQGPDSFVLAYYLPDRIGGGPVTPLLHSRDGASFVYRRITSRSRSRVGVRNVAEITPADTARVPVVTENAASIAKYGRRFIAASENRATHIDTPAEAGDLGLIYVTDTGTPKTPIGLELPFNYAFELNDLFSVQSDGRTFDREDLIFGASHIELHYAGGKGHTMLQGREGGGAAQAKAWLDSAEHRDPKLVYVKTTAPVGPAREGALWAEIGPI